MALKTLIILLFSMTAIISCVSHPKKPDTHKVYSFNHRNSIIWLGHATTLFNIDGKTFITDPVLSNCLALLKRKNTLGLRLEQLPKIDAILISHAHMDHFHKSTLKRMNKNITLILPKELVAEARALGFNRVLGIIQGETINIGSIKVSAKPVKHAVPSLSYIIEGSKSVYFGGDSAYFAGYKSIGQDHNIDIALLPIGPIHAESLKAHHLTPAQAITAFHDLKAQHILPIHHSTFRQGPAMIWPFFDITDEIKLFRYQLKHQGLLKRALIVEPGIEIKL
ncbi:MBL fold metallo-hydrolase [Beggiatoa alba]|nr:MBL fold metallo-hydrolase [Beggiatoa alba]